MTHYLPISKINTYVYCPRRFYLEHVAGEERANIHLDEGQRQHETVDTRAVELKRGETLVSRRVYVASETPVGAVALPPGTTLRSPGGFDLLLPGLRGV